MNKSLTTCFAELKEATTPRRLMRMICCYFLLFATAFAAEELPVKRVVLFTSGVNFFQREGEVTGDATVQLSFRTEQINDLLKSLVLQDFGGGKIAPVVF